MTTLAVDIGGTGIKAAAFDDAGQQAGDALRVATPYPCPPERLLDELGSIAARLPATDRVGLGFPGLLRSGRVVWVNSLMRATFHGEPDDELVRAWRGLPLADKASGHLGLPVRAANDADVHALASVDGRGLECVLTLGTGLGFSLVDDGRLLPHLELSEAPFDSERDFEAALGQRGLDANGIDGWLVDVQRGIAAVRRFVYFDRLHLGGGNARLLAGVSLGDDVRLVDNANGLRGGYLLWSN